MQKVNKRRYRNGVENMYRLAKLFAIMAVAALVFSAGCARKDNGREKVTAKNITREEIKGDAGPVAGKNSCWNGCFPAVGLPGLHFSGGIY